MNKEQKLNTSNLLSKYDIPAPRYTSYPTVPYWTDNPSTEEWINSLNNTLNFSNKSLSAYFHIPFCETLCTFCGCNTSITKNHSLVEIPYLDALEAEIKYYLASVPKLSSSPFKEVHLGGGTPTYFSDENMERLLSMIHQFLYLSNDTDLSIEVDPRRTRVSQLEILYKYGFKRISLGVQDFDKEVQRLVNRIQPFEITKKITESSRKIGFESVNFDLIYGLPRQNLESMKKSIDLTISLRPDRIAFYSYAHVPWIKSSQRLFTEDDLPKAKEKRELYEQGRQLLEANGYKEIGMDHFALESDGLWKALENGTLHRNFMGYTEKYSDILLGFGTSAISESPDCFHQNEKLEIKYRKLISEGSIPTLRGHKLNEKDKIRKKLILEFMTTWKVSIPLELLEDAKEYLSDMELDGLIKWEENILRITETGKPFLRIVCTVFDERYRVSKPSKNLFSKAL
ncbi:MAG: oxygen-independent coproporphyrinogen III oxidase [Leptospiraceae bacterium]|jgi:coproporphyrinogen III oxidase/oxygen-independent coproporphyrinogen-3 oxidase|nr:oxygen-independent coproporphyrinogen III oxidase [Leptospiraceae bacterium]MCZ8344931.1 oxygen-independent coproporphyrinogen III oxidase [Leptospiraceae bacterium]